MTHATKDISPETPVSICIGSDQYEGVVVRTTPATILAKCKGRGDSTARVFRLDKDGTWREPLGRKLIVGECETILDPHF